MLTGATSTKPPDKPVRYTPRTLGNNGSWWRQSRRLTEQARQPTGVLIPFLQVASVRVFGDCCRSLGSHSMQTPQSTSDQSALHLRCHPRRFEAESQNLSQHCVPEEKKRRHEVLRLAHTPHFCHALFENGSVGVGLWQ